MEGGHCLGAWDMLWGTREERLGMAQDLLQDGQGRKQLVSRQSGAGAMGCLRVRPREELATESTRRVLSDCGRGRGVG